jgi:hypothetical protein
MQCLLKQHMLLELSRVTGAQQQVLWDAGAVILSEYWQERSSCSAAHSDEVFVYMYVWWSAGCIAHLKATCVCFAGIGCSVMCHLLHRM